MCGAVTCHGPMPPCFQKWMSELLRVVSYHGDEVVLWGGGGGGGCECLPADATALDGHCDFSRLEAGAGLYIF